MTATTWNLLADPVKDVAYAIKRRAVMSGSSVLVCVRDSGAVDIQRTDKPLRELPDGWLVGHYTRKAPLTDIADDLGERLREIGA